MNHETPSMPQHLNRSMVLVPAGDFTMGSWSGDADERPVRRVYLDAYFMDRDQLAVGQYARFWKPRPTHHRRIGIS